VRRSGGRGLGEHTAGEQHREGKKLQNPMSHDWTLS
jgi:hypothetical protein